MWTSSISRSFTRTLLLSACCVAWFSLLDPAETSGAPAADSQVDVELAQKTWTIPPELKLRARVAAIKPAEPTDLAWRYGGEGLGGRVANGVLGKNLAVGQWSDPVAVASLAPTGQAPKILFLTFTAGQSGKLDRSETKFRGSDRVMVGASKDVQIEFEFTFRDKLIKQFSEAGPEGGTVGIVIPAGKLIGGKTPDHADFVDNLGGLLSYAQRRADDTAALPWANGPLPTRYAIQTDLGGYGEGIYYGIRTTNRAVIEAECRTLRELGINGLRNSPGFLLEMISRRDGVAKDLGRIRDTAAVGFPVAPVSRNKDDADPEAGCPYGSSVAERTKAGVEQMLKALPQEPAEEVWGLTVDEIGSVFDGTPEGKRHLAVCPRCAAAFRLYLQKQKLQPADVGKSQWDEVSPLDMYQKEFKLDESADRATSLLGYHTAMFVNDTTASLFTPLRDALAKLNEEKRAALAGKQNDTAAAKRPFVYSYALRGNTFLMGGHSLDFFDFYRHADNGFVYETSNRDARVWQWDSYLCDVGRVVSAEHGLRFGVYVKPHRGAPLQRALSAVSRNAQMLYWYTYGPDWAKGDTFAAEPEAIALASKTARLLGKCEDVLYGSSWVAPAEIAIVSPRSSELAMRRLGSPPDRVAAWENAKWTYTALAHSHLAVDAIDERMLAEKSLGELARYKVLYINGPNLTAAAASKVATWVEAGGTLYTSAGGLRCDEAEQPLVALQEVLGLERRDASEMWKRPELYNATSIESFDEPKRQIAEAPAGARVQGTPPLDAALTPIVGREVLRPKQASDVVATFADGGAAVTRHRHGKGTAWVVGVFAGLEYSAPLRNDRFNMASGFDAARRRYATIACEGVVKPVIECEQPAVEGVLLRNDATGKQALTLMNWTYRMPDGGKAAGKASPEIVPFENLRVFVRGVGKATSVKATSSGQALEFKPHDGGLSIVVPRLEEGEVLLFE